MEGDKWEFDEEHKRCSVFCIYALYKFLYKILYTRIYTILLSKQKLILVLEILLNTIVFKNSKFLSTYY